MKRAIHKHELSIALTQTVTMHPAASILSVQVQGDKVVLWESHPTRTANPDEPRTIEMVGTGQEYEARDRKYIGTVQLDWHVWHFFEVLQ